MTAATSVVVTALLGAVIRQYTTGDGMTYIITILMVVVSIHESEGWRYYDPASDFEMGPVTDLHTCGVEANLLKLRNGSIKGWACIGGATEVGRMILPPYDGWPVIKIDPDCDTTCLRQRYNERGTVQ